jgi:hypothetical protein
MRHPKPTIDKGFSRIVLEFLLAYIELRVTEKRLGTGNEKLRAAILMASYPGIIYRLEDIATHAGCARNTLGSWARRKTFLAVCDAEAEALGRFMANAIKSALDGDTEIVNLLRRHFRINTAMDDELAIALADILGALGGIPLEVFYGLHGRINDLAFYALVSRLHGKTCGIGAYGAEVSKKVVCAGFDILLHPGKYPKLTRADRDGVAENLEGWMIRLIEEGRTTC